MFSFKRESPEDLLNRQTQIKKSYFDFDRIRLFFDRSDQSDAYQIPDDRTINDLDFEELFMFLDRTSSKIGQQYLYTLLRTIPKDNNRIEELEKRIAFLENDKRKVAAIRQLRKLNRPAAYSLQNLIFGEHLQRPVWYWVIPVLSLLSFTCLIISFIVPPVVFVFLALMVTNMIIHYWNKTNILSYSNSILQLLILRQIVKNFLKDEIFQSSGEITSSLKAINHISKWSGLFKLESKLADDISQVGEFIIDLVKAAFLIEPIAIFNVVQKLEKSRSEMEILFRRVAEIDVALSISALRKTLSYCSQPVFADFFQVKEIFHPLLEHPVANDLALSDGQSVLISGSNMSGKTTFIRTVGINALLAQTINTACAREMKLPKLKILSAINMSDSLMESTSYYLEEVKTVKTLVKAADTQNQYLFLLDELFKGTNTVERVASGKAVLSHLNRNKHIVFASTHDLELTDFLSEEYDYFHFVETIRDNELVFDYQLKDGRVKDTNAIRILELYDFPKSLTKEATLLAAKITEMKTSN